jgi:hypothetical protein
VLTVRFLIPVVVDETYANTSEVEIISDDMTATISLPEKRGANTAFAPFSDPSHALQACFNVRASNPLTGFQARTSGPASRRNDAYEESLERPFPRQGP